MLTTAQIGEVFKQKLALTYSPVGFYFTAEKPAGALGFKTPGNGCMMPLVLASAKGGTVAFDENSTGWPCSAFYLGYQSWILPGVEYFLSDGPIGRDCERFVKTPEQARRYIESLRPEEKASGVAIFKPLEQFSEVEQPEVVIFFANPDQLSALVYLLYFNAPAEENRVVARFTSACGAIITLPLQYARRGEKKAVWGMHDISARARLPKELMTLALPWALLVEMVQEIEGSFLNTGQWAKLVQRF
jgi:uncharacterized protein (DUF169 family)